MTTQTRDTQFAIQIDQIAEAIHWPEPSFTISLRQTAIDVVVAFYEAFATPDRTMLQHALNGIAF
jgi:hypothetical protein